jgi:hypothetical protein
MCFSPKSNNIEMCASISKDIILRLKFDVTKMEKEKNNCKKNCKNCKENGCFTTPT